MVSNNTNCFTKSLENILKPGISIFSIFILIIISVLSILNDKYASKIIGNQDWKYMKKYVIFFVLKLFIRFYYDVYIDGKAVLNANHFFNNIMNKFLSLDIKDGVKQSGNLVTNFNNIMNHKFSLIEIIYKQIIKNVILSLAYSSVFAYYKPSYIKLFLPWLICNIIVFYICFNKLNKEWVKYHEYLAKFNDKFHDHITNIWNLKYNSFEKESIKELTDSFNDRTKQWKKFIFHFCLYTGPIAGLFILILFYFSVRIIIFSKMDVANRIFLLLILQETIWIYWDVWYDIMWMYKETKFISPICELWDVDRSIVDDKDSLKIDVIKNIKYSNVTFSYVSSEVILDNISLEFKQGESIAILGQSGIGKSTILNLLYRLYETTEGKVKINDINIKNVSLCSLRDNIAIVPQKVDLFTTKNVRDNIITGRKDNGDKVKKLKDLLNINDIDESEMGGKISHGQKQRVMIARSLYNMSHSVYIFDEYLSAVDPLYADDIHKVIINEMKKNNKISIYILHDIKKARLCDKIYVLKNKKFKEYSSNDISSNDL